MASLPFERPHEACGGDDHGVTELHERLEGGVSGNECMCGPVACERKQKPIVRIVEGRPGFFESNRVRKYGQVASELAPGVWIDVLGQLRTSEYGADLVQKLGAGSTWKRSSRQLRQIASNRPPWANAMLTRTFVSRMIRKGSVSTGAHVGRCLVDPGFELARAYLVR